MSLKDRAKATAKDLEGKMQESAGNLTGNRQAQTDGQAKQDEAKVSQAIEDGKDAFRKAGDNVRHAAKDVRNEADKATD